MRKLATALLLLACSLAMAQEKSFDFKFYGRIRADLFYNSRTNNETVDGLFYLYPKDHDYDADGNDLNATPQGSFYLLYTRLGVDIKGPNVGTAKLKAKVEIDFRGSSTSYALARIRHAYVSLAWTRSSVLVGQTWHPLFGEVFPNMLNLSTGAPFQPFNRSPLIKYAYSLPCGLQASAWAIWQMQYNSMGPDGKSHNYLKNSCIPELYIGIDYKRGHWQAGIGAEMLSLKPRQKSVVDGVTYKVNERVTSFSATAHLRYNGSNWMASAKTTLANNLTHNLMLGGFGATEVNERTGEMSFTPFRHSATWFNFVYGNKWQPGIFVGYMKNLGTSKPLAGPTYGVGLDVDQLAAANLQLTYNLPHWKIGLEGEISTAWYGTLNNSNGRVTDTHSVSNYRLLAVAMFIF